MPDFNKGDFTQQGVNGHVNATVRLNEKRLVNIDLTSNEEDEGCTITGQITDLLNNIVYPLGEAPQFYDFIGKDSELVFEKDEVINLDTDTTYSSWTPSTTAGNIVTASERYLSGYAVDANYVYTVITTQHLIAEYDSDTVNSAVLRNASTSVSFALPTYKDLASLEAKTYNAWTYKTGFTWDVTIYRNSSGTLVLGLQRQGAPAYTSFGGSAPVGIDGTLSITRYEVKAQCNTTNFSTTAATHIVPANTNLYLNLKMFRTPAANSNLSPYYPMNINTLESNPE